TVDASSDQSVWVVSPTEEVSNATLEGLGSTAKLLVVDDAQERGDLAALLGYVANSNNNARLLMAVRPHGRGVVRAAANSFGLGARFTEIELGPLTLAQTKDLAVQVLEVRGTDRVVAQEVADVTRDSPLSTIVGAQVVAAENLHPRLLGSSEAFKSQLLP